MANYRSTYTFSITNNTRTFHHRWSLLGVQYECNACTTSCDASAQYSQHWRATADVARLLCSDAQRAQLATIAARRICNFLLCNEYHEGAQSTNRFLVDAGICAIPQLLRLLFHDAARLHLRLSFYTRAANNMDFLFTSSELTLTHHLDIAQAVDVIFQMLLEKIETYMLACYSPQNATLYRIQRIKIHVRRTLKTQLPLEATHYALPLQYRVKHATSTAPMPVVNAASIALANIYCFRVCARTQELYVVPYQLGSVCDQSQMSDDVESWDKAGLGAHYIMLQSVDDKVEEFLEIKNLTRFLRTDANDYVHSCSQCNMNFTQRTHLWLHNALDCGRGFEVMKLDSDFVEIYDNCLDMRCDNYKWALYGIIEH
ncbi:protein terminus-like [Ceratitis capitata]|uniref:protein terminus-like n=1 Tax=Ceratitis capitata TaxID=7213 RepID=UPI00032A1AE0|nr:protein terminus-like [Ceratitis capitata]